MYEVYLERSAERDLKRLSAEDYHRIIPHIKALSNNPRPSGCRKSPVQKELKEILNSLLKETDEEKVRLIVRVARAIVK